MNLSKANPYAVAAIAIAAALIGTVVCGTVVCALSVAAAVVPQEDARADPAVGIAPVADRDVYRNGRFPEAKGEGRYRCEDSAGELRVEFTKLVPNGVYTMWHAFMAWPPTEPFIGTYGPLPGELATKPHIHMYTGLPKRSGL